MENLLNSPFAGTPVITALEYVPESMTLKCISSGGPVDDVIWKKDGIIVNNETFSHSQSIRNTTSATYEHNLKAPNYSDFVGNFTCIVKDTDGNSNEKTMELKGLHHISYLQHV